MAVEESLQTWDLVVLFIYLAIVFAVGIWTTCRPNKNTATGYFLAGKEMTWFFMGCSVYASNVGAPMFIGMTGSAALSGIAVTIFEWHAVFMILTLGWLFLPIYTASGVATMPEYVRLRFGGKRLQIYLSFLGLLLYILTKISIEMYAGAVFIQRILQWNLYACVVLLLAIVAVYTIAGGLASVIYMDTLQITVVIGSAVALAAVSLSHVGSYDDLQTAFMVAVPTSALQTNSSCGIPPSDSFHLLRDPLNSDLPWTGMLLGLTPTAMWVWCTDQVMVQRTLAAKNLTHARAATVFASVLKLVSFALFIIPGLVSRVLYLDEVACSTPETCEAACGSEAGCSNLAYPLLVLRLMPEGLKGLMLASLLAALMSSLTSIFNSASSMFTLDVWTHARPKATNAELMVVSRVFTLVTIGVSVAWLPIVREAGGGQLWVYLQSVSAYIAPPWCIVFLCGIFSKRVTEAGAFWGLMAGLITGLIRLVIDFVFPAVPCGSSLEGSRPVVLTAVHYLHFSAILSVVTFIVVFFISIITKPRPSNKLHRVTWWTRDDVEFPEVDKDDSPTWRLWSADEERSSKVTRTAGEKNAPGTIWQKSLLWLCGVDTSDQNSVTAEEAEISRETRLADKLKKTSTWINPNLNRLLNILGASVLFVTVFLFGFFA